MRDEETLYAVLNVSEDATREDIRRAARSLLQKHHPDRGGDPELAARINAAATTLADPDKRTTYDQTLHAPAEPEEPAAPPEPDWGDSTSWADTTAPPAPSEPGPIPEPESAPEPEPAPAPVEDEGEGSRKPRPTKDPSPRTPVRTAAHTALFAGAIPLALVAVALAALAAVRDSDLTAALIGGIAGAVLGIIAAVRFPSLRPGRRASHVLGALTVICAAYACVQLPVQEPIPQGGVAAAVSAVSILVIGTNLRKYAGDQRLLKSRSLRDNGMIFGSSNGDPASELLRATVWDVLGREALRGARGFQMSGQTSFPMAILCGDRVALLRPLALPAGLGAAREALHWSSPALFLRDAVGMLHAMLHLDLAASRSAFAQVAPRLLVEEFVVIYQPGAAHPLAMPGPAAGAPTTLNVADAGDVIADFLAGARRRDVVRHDAAVNTILAMNVAG